ncbi:MAG: tRNA pseudouridine(55) synthase TruB [Clostridia bacterium]
MTAGKPSPCGFLNVLKPPGMSSAQVVGMAHRMLDGAKVGHAGTLDPEAAGVLPLMTGKAARLFDYMQEKEKGYVAEIAFGTATDTQDAQGMPVSVGADYPGEDAIRAMLPRFTGTLMQRPPMYSAIKQNGRCLYELAREGQEAEVAEREVTVHQLCFRGMTPNHGALLYLRCSKGFYVRTLCHDLGVALGCPAHMRFLLRTQSGVFTLQTAHTLEELQALAQTGMLAQTLLPPETVLHHLPWAVVPAGLEKAVRNGGKLPWARFTELHGTAAELGKPACLWLHGTVCAIGERVGEEMKLRTWLADERLEGGNLPDANHS